MHIKFTFSQTSIMWGGLSKNKSDDRQVTKNYADQQRCNANQPWVMFRKKKKKQVNRCAKYSTNGINM